MMQALSKKFEKFPLLTLVWRDDARSPQSSLEGRKPVNHDAEPRPLATRATERALKDFAFLSSPLEFFFFFFRDGKIFFSKRRR